MTNSRFVNRSVYEGADMIALRLRAAKKPAVIPFLEIPPEEIDLEPVTIEPVDLTDAEPMPIMPLVVPASDILPFDDDNEGENVSPPVSETPTPNTINDGKAPVPGPAAPAANEGLSLFGVGTILDNKSVRDRGGKSRKR
ncbi:MAG: hypothetical protein H0W78_16795 [Planctomycetes bacterium]|nr:hypothetical protein [Planctomycetota bacterium]